MKVSVLMPVYRPDSRFLREAIASVLAQTFGDFEFLILDDCPADDRSQVVAEFSDPRIVYMRNESNLGISASRNLLVERARGGREQRKCQTDHDEKGKELDFFHFVLPFSTECDIISASALIILFQVVFSRPLRGNRKT